MNNISIENHQWFGRKKSFAYLEQDLDNRIRIKKVLNFFNQQKNKNKKKVLDIGCGDGTITAQIKKQGFDTYGIDISTKNVIYSLKRNIKVKKSDASDQLPFNNEFFDIVFAGEIIEHLFDTKKFLSEIKRVLKPSGIVVITTPNLAHLPDRFKLLMGKSPSQIQPLHKFLHLHIRPFTFGTLKDALLMFKFEIIKMESTTIVFKRNKRNSELVELNSKILSNLFPSLGSFIICYAQKS